MVLLIKVAYILFSYFILFFSYKIKTKKYVTISNNNIFKDTIFIYLSTGLISLLIDLLFRFLSTKVDFGNYIFLAQLAPLIFYIIFVLITVKLFLKNKITDPTDFKKVSGDIVGTYIGWLILIIILLGLVHIYSFLSNNV